MYTARDQLENFEDFLASDFAAIPVLGESGDDPFNYGVKTLDALSNDLSLDTLILDFN